MEIKATLCRCVIKLCNSFFLRYLTAANVTDLYVISFISEFVCIVDCTCCDSLRYMLGKLCQEVLKLNYWSLLVRMTLNQEDHLLNYDFRMTISYRFF